MSHSTAAIAAASLFRANNHFLSPSPNPNPRLPSPIHHRPLRGSSRFPNGEHFRTHCLPLPRLPESLDLPLLPFDSREVLIPSECKTLHLYEARFLALLEESLLRRRKLFVHVVLDPVFTGRSSSKASFAAKYGCLVHVEKVERLKIGALVSIRGIGRVSIVEVMQMEPFLRGVVIPKHDTVPVNEREVESKLLELRGSLSTLHSLQIKLKASKDELLQTPTKNSLAWAERENYEDCDQAFVPKLAERISFATFQPVSGSSRLELIALQQAKLQAMDYKDTLQRLNEGIEFIKQNIAVVAAKLAIQSLET